MTVRHSGYMVFLTEDVREDDAEAVVTALRMVKGVLAVEPVVDSVSSSLTAEMRVRHQVADQLVQMARDILAGS